MPDVATGLLDDAAGLRRADVTGALLHASMAGAQLRAAAAGGPELADRLSGLRPRALVWVTGRSDGARVGAALVAALAERLGGSATPPVVGGRRVPAWAGPLDVVLVSGDDPGDPVLAGAVAEAVRRGCEVVLDVPEEGPVAEAAAGRCLALPGLPHVPDHRGTPRHVGAGLAVLTALGARGLDPSETADAVDDELAGLVPEVASPVNPAKLLAGSLSGSGPVYWLHDDPVAAAVAGLAAHAFAVAGRPGNALAVPDAVRAAADLAATRPPATADPLADLFHDDELDGPRTSAPAPVYLGIVCGSEHGPVSHAAAPLGHVDWITRVPTAGGDAASPPATTREVTSLVARIELAAAYHLVGGP